MIKCDQKGLPLSPDFEIFHDILHIPQLSVQPAPLSGDIVQLTPEVIDIGIKEGLQVLPDSPGALLLQEAPLGLQNLVLLLQEPHLQCVVGSNIRQRLDRRSRGALAQAGLGFCVAPSPSTKTEDAPTVAGEDTVRQSH